MNALDYFLKANLYGLLFVGCYWLLLRRHTFFQLNRFYLLLSVVLTLTLPLVSLPQQTVETLTTPAWITPTGTNQTWSVPVGVIVLPKSVSAPVSVETGPDWEQLGLLAYGLVALLFVVLFLVRLGRLLWLIQQAPRHGQEGYTLVQPNDPVIPTFSFFRYLVLNPADAQNELIKAHELVHIRQYHSADVLSIALLRAVFWACPALWLVERLLREVHEFLADKESHRPTDYARFLVEYTFGVKPDTLANGFFNPSLLKQRIIMLHQKATTRWALGKYALVLPLVFGLLAMTTAREELAAVVSQATDETVTVSGRVMSATDGKPLVGATVLVASTRRGTPTDRNGFYILSDVPVSATLAYSHMGYRTDLLVLEAFRQRIKTNRLILNPRLTANLQDELPVMGATAVYKAIKPNPDMPVRTPPSSQTINGEVFTAVEEPAVFPTGIPGLMQYVAHALRYPAKAKTAGIQGDVYVLFTVLPTGAIGDAKINKAIEQIGGGCEEEALRVVRQMPRWIPAKQNSKSVAVRYQIPIRFALEKAQDKRTGQVVTPQPDSSKKMGFMIDDSRNGRFALYNDVTTGNKLRYSISLPDSLKNSGPSIRVRGNNLTGDDPLYIIDGVESSKSGLNLLDPNTIESITVLKTSAATAIYGAKARNGVVTITTKKK